MAVALYLGCFVKLKLRTQTAEMTTIYTTTGIKKVPNEDCKK